MKGPGTQSTKEKARIKASVIIPTLNEEKYLARTLLGLRNQTEEDFEVIVADSYSKDRTVQIARKMGVKVVLTHRLGPGAGRNAGAEIACGEVLIFLDADTWVPNNFVEKVVKYFEQAGVIAATCRYTCNDGNPIDRFMYLLASNALFFFTEFRMFTHLPGFCSFYYRPVFRAMRGFREDLIHVEDGELAARVSKQGKLGYVPGLMVATSARRVKKWGYFKITMSYLADTVLFFTARKIIGRYDLGSF